MADGTCKAALSAQTSQPTGLMESPTYVQQLCTATTANHSQIAQLTVQPPSHSTLSPPHNFFSEITKKKQTQLEETPRDAHDCRGHSHVFPKDMTPDLRFPFSSPFAIPSLKCMPICAFSSEHQACKLLFQAKKSLKEVTPQRTGSAHFLRGSYYVEYPQETKCSHPVSHFFWQSCFSG